MKQKHIIEMSYNVIKIIIIKALRKWEVYNCCVLLIADPGWKVRDVKLGQGQLTQ